VTITEPMNADQDIAGYFTPEEWAEALHDDILLDEVRSALSTISGSLSESVIELREEREWQIIFSTQARWEVVSPGGRLRLHRSNRRTDRFPIAALVCRSSNSNPCLPSKPGQERSMSRRFRSPGAASGPILRASV